VVLRDPAEFGSLAAAEAAGIPSAEVAIGVSALMDWGRTHLEAPLGELDELVGLPEGHLLRASAETPVLTMVPECMEQGARPDRRVVRYRHGSEPGPGRLPAPWGDPEAPLVYVTFGTVAGALGHLTEVFGAALSSLSDLPVRVLLTTGYAADPVLEDVPANAHVERFWPQEDLMPLAAAVVGHGGFGTTMSALAGGVPQVVVPLFTTDQRLNAEAVAALGVGTCLPGGPAAVADLAPAVAALLAEPEYRRRAADVAAEVGALPTAAEVVDEVVLLAASGAG
jgi:UDP:flavonoid glycosyltransferase YjiC (YdhE family)